MAQMSCQECQKNPRMLFCASCSQQFCLSCCRDVHDGLGVKHAFQYFCSKSFCMNAATLFCEDCHCCFCAACNERQHNHAKRFNHKLFDLNNINLFELLRENRFGNPNNHAENNAPTRMNSNLNHAPVNHAEINHRMNSNLNLVSPSFQSVMNTIPTRLKHVESENSDFTAESNFPTPLPHLAQPYRSSSVPNNSNSSFRQPISSMGNNIKASSPNFNQNSADLNPVAGNFLPSQYDVNSVWSGIGGVTPNLQSNSSNHSLFPSFANSNIISATSPPTHNSSYSLFSGLNPNLFHSKTDSIPSQSLQNSFLSPFATPTLSTADSSSRFLSGQFENISLRNPSIQSVHTPVSGNSVAWPGGSATVNSDQISALQPVQPPSIQPQNNDDKMNTSLQSNNSVLVLQQIIQLNPSIVPSLLQLPPATLNNLLSNPAWLKTALTSTSLPASDVTTPESNVVPVSNVTQNPTPSNVTSVPNSAVAPSVSTLNLSTVAEKADSDEIYDPKAIRPVTFDSMGQIIKKKTVMCPYESCKNGLKCEYAHRKEDGYCVACWEDGHTLDSHRSPFCAWCCTSGHSTHSCTHKKTRWCSSVYSRDDCSNGDDCEFAHDRSDIICSYCEFRGHGFAECANRNLTCLTCGEKRHSGVNRDVCESRRPMKIVADDIQEIWIADESEPARRIVPTISIVSATVHNQPINAPVTNTTRRVLADSSDDSKEIREQIHSSIASLLGQQLISSSSESQVVHPVSYTKQENDPKVASNGKRKMQMCPKGTAVPPSCPFGSRCYRAHDKADAFCQACLKFGHTFDTGHNRDRYCVFCQKEGHSTKKCSNKATRWCESVTQGIVCPHRPHCTYAHKREDLVCTFCEIRGHGLDECANPALTCSTCDKKGHSHHNVAVCRGKKSMEICSTEIADYWINSADAAKQRAASKTAPAIARK